MEDYALRVLPDRLAAPFMLDEIEWRIQRSGLKDGKPWARVIPYITARAIMDRLDEVVGPSNWHNEYREWGIGSPGVLCGLSLRFEGEWVTKWDGSEQPETEPVKGGFSTAMKRAAVQWGIGRYLYDVEEGWAEITERGAYRGEAKTKDGKRTDFRWDPPALPKWAVPEGEKAANAPPRLAQTPPSESAEPAKGKPLPLRETAITWGKGSASVVNGKTLGDLKYEQLDYFHRHPELVPTEWRAAVAELLEDWEGQVT